MGERHGPHGRDENGNRVCSDPSHGPEDVGIAEYLCFLVDLHAISVIDRTMSGRSKCTIWPASGTRTAVVLGAPIALGNALMAKAAVNASRPPNTKCTGTVS